MKIKTRMQAILDAAGSGYCAAADIGCDHGVISCGMIKQKRAESVIACDISERSLEKARALSARMGTDSALSFRVADGLNGLFPGEAECLIIAGMGGLQIKRILSEGMKVARRVQRIVLGPHRNEAELRDFLYDAGFCIGDEKTVKEDGRFYQILSVCTKCGFSQEQRNAAERVYGKYPAIRKDPAHKEYLIAQYAKLKKIVVQLNEAEKNSSAALQKKKLLKETEEALKWL